uniref:Proteasome subunit alpha type-1 n=1 Tax=Lygus hesperus TaxID=30085 RepID=A0A0A9VV06_LYGHE
MKSDSVTSLYELTPSIGCCMTGRAPDGRSLVSQAREVASEYHYDYGLTIPIALLAKRLGDKAQVRTQHAGLRPMGVIVTLIGMDQNDADGQYSAQIYTIDPAGWVASFYACASGKKQAEANAYLEKRQKEVPFSTLSEKAAAMIALSAMQNATGMSLRASDVEMGRCTVEHTRMLRVPDAEVEEWLTAVAETD